MPELTDEISNALSDLLLIEKTSFMNGFLNIDFNRSEFAKKVIESVNLEKS